MTDIAEHDDRHHRHTRHRYQEELARTRLADNGSRIMCIGEHVQCSVCGRITDNITQACMAAIARGHCHEKTFSGITKDACSLCRLEARRVLNVV